MNTVLITLGACIQKATKFAETAFSVNRDKKFMTKVRKLRQKPFATKFNKNLTHLLLLLFVTTEHSSFRVLRL